MSCRGKLTRVSPSVCARGIGVTASPRSVLCCCCGWWPETHVSFRADRRLTLCHAFKGTRGDCNFFRLRGIADPASAWARRLRHEAVRTPRRLQGEYGYSTARVLSVSPDSVPGRGCAHSASTDNPMDWKLVGRSA